MLVTLPTLVIAAVLAVAGVAKLADRADARAMLVEFGSPVRLAAPLAWLLIAAELATAVALVVPAGGRIGALAALVLLAGFTAAIAANLARGRRPTCRCFGRLQASEVSWSTVARNGLLAAIAGFVAADGAVPLAFAALALAAAGAWLALELRRPRVGGPAPALELADATGRAWTLDTLLAGRRPLLLLFSDPDCAACRELLPDVARWQDELADRLTVALVTPGAAEGARLVLADPDRAVAAAYGVDATPSAVVIDADRRLAAAPAGGAEEIAALVARFAEGDEPMALPRRTMVARAALALGAVTVLPLASSAAATVRAAKRPKALKVDGAWLCNQRFALCTSAACQPSKTNPNFSVCRCKVTTGYSVGFKTCRERAAKGNQLHSNFSLVNVTSRTRSMQCSAKDLWVQCLDVVCEVDPRNPRRASCACVNFETADFFTFGGNCDTSTCSSVIWSATTAPFPGGAQLEKGLKRMGVPFTSPKGCPTAQS